MSVELFLNECSYLPKAEHSIAAQERMFTLIKTMQKATIAGAKKVLRTQSMLDTVELADNYYFNDWKYDATFKRKYRDEWRFMLSLVSKAPFLVEHPDEANATNRAERSEFTFNGQSAVGLGMAGITNGIAISFDSDVTWDQPTLPLEYDYLNDAAEIEIDQLSVIHGSKPIHIQQHQAWIEEQIKKQVRNGADAWQQKEELFANLEFCASVAEQLKQLHATDLNWNHVLKHLWELQRYANQWKVGAFDPDAIQLNLSVESSATLSQYKAERTFLCPNGEVRLFSWHTKIKFSGWRIYFVPEPQNHHLIVGYIGKHLPTARFK